MINYVKAIESIYPEAVQTIPFFQEGNYEVSGTDAGVQITKWNEELGEKPTQEQLESAWEVIKDSVKKEENDLSSEIEEQSSPEYKEKEKEDLIKKLQKVKNFKEFNKIAQDLVEFIIKY